MASPPDTPDTPDTAAASEPLPAGACDCHVHVIGARDAYPMVPDRHYTPGPASLDALRDHLAALGLQRAVIVQPSVYGTDNRCLLDALDRMDGTGRGVAVPAEDASADELRRMHARGVRGVRINLESSGSQDIAVLEAMLARWSGRVADLGWHVQLYAAPGVVAALADRLAALPVPVVLDHFALMAAAPDADTGGTDGGDGTGATILDLLRTGRVRVKLSAPYRLPSPAWATAWARAFVDAAPASVLWASDWPHTARRPGTAALDVSPYRDIPPRALADDLRDWLPAAASRRRVLVDNAAALYAFPTV